MEGDWEGIGNRNNQQQIYPGEISSVHKITKLLDSLAERSANFNELESGKGTKKLAPDRRSPSFASRNLRKRFVARI